MKYYISIVCFLFSIYPAFSQVNKESNIISSHDTLNYFGWDKLINKKFILLEMRDSLQEKGYDGFSYNKFSNNWFFSYNDWVGKIFTLESVSNNSLLLSFSCDDSDSLIYVNVFKGYIPFLGLIDDMDKAKKKFVGKIIYSLSPIIYYYNYNSNLIEWKTVSLQEPLMVKNIIWGILGYDVPLLWVIVEKKDKTKCFIPIDYSWFNAPQNHLKVDEPWQSSFTLKNPIKKNIIKKDAGISIGMSKEQVITKWGKPNKINKTIFADYTHEQWIYGESYLYFENDILTSIQTSQ